MSVIREVAGPFGVPDFVAVVGPSQVLHAREALGVPPLLNEVDAGIASVLSPRAPKNIPRIASALGWSSATIDRRLPSLVRLGAASATARGRYLRPGPLQLVGRLYAIETKVRDWRSAVRQGRRYRLWCDNYVIVMAQLSISTLADAIDAVSSDGGGLMVGGRWAVRPRASGLPSSRRLWGSEHVVAAALGVVATTPRSQRIDRGPEQAL